MRAEQYGLPGSGGFRLKAGLRTRAVPAWSSAFTRSLALRVRAPASAFGLFTLSLILSLCMLIACDKGGSPTYEDGLNEGLRKGWEAGAKAMAEEMARQATEVRRLLREPMRGRLLVLAVVAAIMTLFGAKWADAARQWLAMRFHVPLPVQADLATALYLSAVMALILYSLGTCGLRDSIPVMVLASGSLIPFLDCRSALLAGDATRRRAAGPPFQGARPCSCSSRSLFPIRPSTDRGMDCCGSHTGHRITLLLFLCIHQSIYAMFLLIYSTHKNAVIFLFSFAAI